MGQETVTDELTPTFFNIKSSSYTDFSASSPSSKASYIGHFFGVTTKLQMNSSRKKGIITTASGGSVKSITIEFDSSNSNALRIYGKNTAYSSTGDINSTSTAGTLIQDVDNSKTAVTITPTTKFQYVAFCSKNGAVYISKITIVWETAASSEKTSTTLSFGTDFDNKTITKNVNDIFETPATLSPTIEGATITYNSSNPDVAEIDGGVIETKKEGTTTITASYAGDDTYKESTVSYTLNVVDNRTETTLTFPTSSYSYTQGDNDGEDLIENPVTISTSGISADKIKYTVTGTTGIVEGNIDTDGIVVINTNIVGTATITATFDGDKTYKPATTSYTITVKNKAIAEDEVFDFSKPENYGYEVPSTTGSGKTLAVGTKITAGNITLEIKKKGTNDASWWYDGVLRIYKNSEHELSVIDGYHITSVIIVPTTNNYGKSIIIGGTTGTNWTGSAKTVSIVNDESNNSRIKSITVTYEKDIELTTAASGFATYAASYPVNYKELGLTAYAVKVSSDNTKVSYTKLEDAVPANIPVLVQGASKQTVALTPASTTASSVDTDLKMSDGNIVGDGSLIYGFTTKNGVSGFYRVQNGLTVPANKGYIQLSSAPASETKFFSFDGGEGTTGIGNIENIEKQIMLDNATIYNLAGQRVSKDYKGVIIVNGKKMVNK